MFLHEDFCVHPPVTDSVDLISIAKNRRPMLFELSLTCFVNGMVNEDSSKLNKK